MKRIVSDGKNHTNVWKKGHSVRSKDRKGAKPPIQFLPLPPHTYTRSWLFVPRRVSDNNRQHRRPACLQTRRHPTAFSFGPRPHVENNILCKWASQYSVGCPPPSNFSFLSSSTFATALPVLHRAVEPSLFEKRDCFFLILPVACRGRITTSFVYEILFRRFPCMEWCDVASVRSEKKLGALYTREKELVMGERIIAQLSGSWNPLVLFFLPWLARWRVRFLTFLFSYYESLKEHRSV